MYLHLGQSVVVPFRDIVGLFDLDNTTASHLTRAALERAEREGRVVNVGEDLPKAFALCRPAGGRGKQGESRIYLTQLSTATLLRRSESDGFE